ncbi:MAG: Hsp20/alpha crystallin family protein [Pseudomonadales bacterium]
MNQPIYSPFGALNQLHRELSRAFDDPVAGRGNETPYEATNWLPQVDICEDEAGFTVTVDVPGVAPKDIDITLDHNTLTIKGTRSTTTESEEGSYKRRERISGTFIRQFTLPRSADADAIKARVDNGVLEVAIPKVEANKPRTISVE